MRPHPYAVIVKRCADVGLQALSADELARLRDLFVKETRIGAFLPSSDIFASVLSEFLAHVSENLAAIPLVAEAFGMRPHFARKARSATLAEPAGREEPVAVDTGTSEPRYARSRRVGDSTIRRRSVCVSS